MWQLLHDTNNEATFSQGMSELITRNVSRRGEYIMMQNRVIILFVFSFAFLNLCVKFLCNSFFSFFCWLFPLLSSRQTGSEREGSWKVFLFQNRRQVQGQTCFLRFKESPPDNTYRMKKRCKSHSNRTVLDQENENKITGRDFKWRVIPTRC